MADAINKKLILLMAIFLITLSQLNNNAYTPAFPSLAAAFFSSFTKIKFSYTLSAFFFGLSQLIYGPLSDKYGRKKIIIFGLSLFMSATLWVTMTKTITLFLCGRALQGIGIGCAGPIASAMVRDVASGKELNKMFSYISLAIFITPVLGPLIGGYLQQLIGWNAIFIFLFLYSLLIYCLVRLKLPETNLNISRQNYKHLHILQRYIAVLRNKKFRFYLMILILLYSGEMTYVIQLPILAQVSLGLNSVTNGWIMIYTASGMFLGSFFSSRLLERTSIHKLFMIGISLITLGSLLMFTFAVLNLFNLYVIILPMAVYMMGSGMLFPNCIAGCLHQFSEMHGVASSLMSGLLMLNSAIISLVAVLLPTNNQFSLAIFLLLSAILLTIISFKVMRLDFDVAQEQI